MLSRDLIGKLFLSDYEFSTAQSVHALFIRKADSVSNFKSDLVFGSNTCSQIDMETYHKCAHYSAINKCWPIEKI